MAPTNKKMQGRQTNNSLSSMTEHILIPLQVNSASETSRKKKTVTSSKLTTEIFTETEEVLQIGMHKVLEHVKNHDDAWPFMDPVEEDIAPRYYSIIRRPMDLQRMEEKLDGAEYSTFSEFKNDFKLIVNNCRLYNGQNNEYTEMVNNLQIAFEKATRKYFDQSSSDEETFFDFLDVKHDAFHEKVLSEKIKNKKLLQLDMDIEEDDLHVSKKRKNGEEKHHKDEEELVHKSKKLEKKSGECCNDPKKESIKKSDQQYDSLSSNKIVKTKIDYDDIETCFKKKDKKKIIKEIKKKHKEKGKIKGKIKRERGRPKGSHKHKTQKVIDSKASDASVVDNERFTNDDFSTDIPPWREKSEKKHKKGVYKLLKKEKEKKIKYKNSSRKSKKHLIDNDSLSDVSSSKFDNVENLRAESGKKISSSNYNKGDKKLLESKDDEKEREQKLKKKSKKKQKQILEEAIGEVVEKKKPGRPKVKHLEKLEGEYKKEKKKKQRDKTFESGNKESKDKDMDEVDPYNSGSELSEHSLNNNFNFDDDSLERPLTPDIIDKYDLIKQRRRQKQSEDSRSKQSSERSSVDKSAIKKQSNATDVSFSKSSAKYENNIKNSHGSSEEKKLSPSSSREPKNHRLQETIEKLKKKSKKNKKENALLDEIFGVKPAKKINDEKSIYKKIRETYGGEKESGSQNKMMDVAAKQPKNICEYDFIDDLVISKDGYEEKSSNQKLTTTEHSFITPSKKKEQAPSGKHTHKNSSKSEKQHQKCVKKQEKANMEALELETEQTLKDINKWLELTPHMSEFGSASSSPSRYIIDDLDAVPTRTDDFIRTVPILQENQENHQNLNSQFDALKNDGKVGLHDHNVTNKQIKTSPLNSDQKTSKVTAKQELKTRKTTKLLNYVPARKREHQRTIDRLQPGKSKGNLLSSVNVAKKTETDVKPDLISTKVKEIKNSLIVETSEGGPKLSLGTVLDSEGFGLIQQHNFQDDKPNIDENDEKPADIDDEESPKQEEHLRWGDVSKKEESASKKSSETSSEQNEEENDKKKDEPKPNLSAWFKAFGIPKKQPTVPTTSMVKDGSCGDSLSQTLGVANNLPQPTMRQRKSSTGSTTSELSSVSQDPDSPRITIDESYTGSYKSPIQLPIVTSPKAGEFSPRQQVMSNYEINGPIKVGFYQDITKCSPDKSPQQLANTTPQYSMAHRTPPNPSLMTSLQNNFSYYTKTDNSQPPSATTVSSIDPCHKQTENSNHDNSDYSGSPNNPNSPYQNKPMSPYLQNPQSPFTSQSHSQQSNPSKSFAPSQNMQSLLPCSSHSSIPEAEKYSTPDIDKTLAALPQSEKQLNNNEQKHIQPPTYTSAPQFSLENLPKQSTETCKTPVTEPAIPGRSDINTPHYTNTNISSTSNQALNIKTSDQSAWPPQGLYGPNIDKNLFPLSLTNTTTSDLSQNQSNNNVLTQSQSQELCNNQSYSQMFGFDGRQKKQSDCMNTAHSTLINDPVSLVAKNQDSLRKQQSLITSEVYDNKTPIDYANPSSDRYKSSETYNSAYKSLHGVMQGSKNQNTFDTQTRQQTKSSMPSTNISKQYADHLQQQQSMFGNNRPTNYLGADPVDLKSSAIPHSNHPKPLDGASQNINPYGNNYMTHGQQGQNPPADYTMGGAPLQNTRYTDLSRQTSTSHQHSQMDAYKNTAYIRNFASMMAEMGLPPTTQNPYSQSMAHQFAKTFHQVTTAALQQFLPGSAMTTTAYSKSSREDDTRSASSKGFPTTSQQTSSSSVISQYLGANTSNPGTREASLTSQQQQHMVAYQQKFSEAANMSQGPDITQGHPVEIKHTSTRKSSKSSSKKSKQSPQVAAHVSQQEMLLNSGMGQTSSSSYPPQTIPSAHNFPPYGASNISGKIADNLSNPGAKVGANSASSTAGSAFNFTPTPSLPLPGPPPGLYAETPNYLEDFRGTANPYYPIGPPTGHRNTTEITADKTNTTPGNTPTVSAPYHQFLPHPSTRTGYPFMNPASFDPLQQQWNLQREEQLRAQMMLASNPYSQSGYPRHLWG